MGTQIALEEGLTRTYEWAEEQVWHNREFAARQQRASSAW
jgi:hypothetical protein